MRHSHEFDETRYAEYGMEGVLEIHDLNGEYLLMIVHHLTKCDP
jgi:hypothetical protein